MAKNYSRRRISRKKLQILQNMQIKFLVFVHVLNTIIKMRILLRNRQFYKKITAQEAVKCSFCSPGIFIYRKKKTLLFLQFLFCNIQIIN